MDEIAISIKNVSKLYKLYKNSSDRLKEALHPFGKKYHQDFYAVRNMSLEVKRGEILGIVGRNGCGKSTLLKLVSKVLQPNNGEIKVNGKVTALLELGAGFNPEFTGRQNITFYATILGLDAKEIEALTPNIIGFAELGEFIDQPVKTYSSGMKSRLGFAVASQLDSDILILDEILAVGDELFVKKCYEVIRGFIRRNKTILLVSHSAQAIADFCTRAVLINQGRVEFQGEPADTIKEYRKLLYGGEQLSSKQSVPEQIDFDRYDPELECSPTIDIDCQVLRLEQFALTVGGNKANIVKYDDEIALEIILKELVPIDWDGLHTGTTIVTKTGFRLAGLKFSSISHLKDRVILKTKFKCPLNQGLYSVIFSVIDKADLDYKIFVNDLFVFKVLRHDKDHFHRWAQIEIKGQ
jgi:ABC-type polysaccharide/polyol phosphate transport system ATPase subunit